MDIPTAPSGLLLTLQKAFPDKLPRVELSAFEQGRRVGQQDVIDRVIQFHEKEYKAHVRSQS